MSKIKHGGLDQYDAEPFEQQQFGTAGVEGAKNLSKWNIEYLKPSCNAQHMKLMRAPQSAHSTVTQCSKANTALKY